MKNELTVKAIQHRDVKGKLLYYLEITDGETLFHINVGEKTFTTVYEMETQLKLNLDEPKTREPKVKKIGNELK